MSRSVAFRFRTETWFLWSGSLVNDSASDSAASIPRRLSLQVIRLVVDHNGLTDEGIGSLKGEPVDYALEASDPLLVGFDITEVTRVMIGIRWSPVLGCHRVEVAPGRSEISGRAIAFFMDVKTVLAGSQAGNVSSDPYTFGFLAKGDSSGDILARGRSQNSHCCGS